MIEFPGDRSGYELRRDLHQSQRSVALSTADAESDRCQRVIESLKGTIQVPTLRLNYATAVFPDSSPRLARCAERCARGFSESVDRNGNVLRGTGKQCERATLELVS